MRAAEQRERDWAALSKSFDLLVIGGGITGAAIARQAVRAGVRVALVEGRDFAWGTSSRSTKLVHGGLRYLAQGDLKLVRESVRERRRLLAEAPGLVSALQMVVLSPRPGAARWVSRVGIAAYHALAGRRGPRELTARDLLWAFPDLRIEPASRGLPYEEARVDDARLVLRLVREAVRGGAVALNHVRVTALIHERGEVAGAVVENCLDHRQGTIRARAVINATGAAADRLRAEVGGAPKLRPIRGSHLVFPAWRFPLSCGVTLRHPRGGRYLSALPWEDATLVGTTDVDHADSSGAEPCITPAEVAYLLEALAAYFPALALAPSDALSAFAGVRPIVTAGFADPSREPRDSWIGLERGMLTVTGGKLTTCRATAHAALAVLRTRVPGLSRLDSNARLFDPAPDNLEGRLPAQVRPRLLGRYAVDAPSLAAVAKPGELEPIADTSTLWAELRWAARAEAVGHLDDLLLRRVRLGLTLAGGGAGVLERVGEICVEELGWDAQRWEAERAAYRLLLRDRYAVPLNGPAVSKPVRAAAAE